MNKVPPFGRTVFLIFILTEIVSFLGFYYPPVANVAFGIALIAALVASLTKLEYGMYIVVGELLLGSKTGALIALNYHGISLSYRMALFAVIISVFVFRIIQQRKLPRFFSDRMWRDYAILGVFLGIAVMRGLAQNTTSAVFFDANAFLYLLLLFPAYEAITNWHIVRRIFLLIGIGVEWMLIKTLFVLYVFSHSMFGLQKDLYDWLSATGVGQVALVSGRFFRVFIASQVFAIIPLLIVGIGLILYYFYAHDHVSWRVKSILSYHEWAVVVISTLVLILSFSRSIWLGILMGIGAILLMLLIIKKITMRQGSAIVIIMMILLFASWGALDGVVNFPLPHVDATQGVALFDRLNDLVNQAGGSTRLNQLQPLWSHIRTAPWLGYGFGKELTYITTDPKNILETVHGQFTTYAFEWAWLDLWLKGGIVAVLAYLGILGILAIRSLKLALRTDDRAQKAWLFASFAIIITLAMVHVTTPYLNHPLGISILIILSASIFTLQHHHWW